MLIEAVHTLQSDQKVKVNSSSQEGGSARVGWDPSYELLQSK